MTLNKIKKECPFCGYGESDINGASVTTKIENKETIFESFNNYKCLNPKCKKQLLIKRNGNKAEQDLTEKFIQSKNIVLK